MWLWQESEIQGLTGLSAGHAAKTAAGERPPAYLGQWEEVLGTPLLFHLTKDPQHAECPP